MIEHLVILSIKASATEAEVTQALRSLEALMEAIPEIKTFKLLKNNSKESFATPYPYGFVMTFDSQKDRDTYVNHPSHVKLAKIQLLPLLAQDPVVFDYES